MCNSIRLTLLKILISLLVSIPIFFILVLRYFTGFPSIKDRDIMDIIRITYVLLPTSLILLLIKDMVPGSTRYRGYLILFSLIFVSLYSLIGSLADIARLEPGKYVYIPPMFIITEYQLEKTYTTLRSLTISIPLCTTFGIFIYGLYEIVKAYRALKIKKIDKAIDGFNIQGIHNVECQGNNS